MSQAKDEIIDWLGALAATPSPSVATATSQALDILSDTVATAIVNALNRSGYHWSQADHVLCDFLAATACAMHKFEDQFQSQVEHIVTLILAARRQQRRKVIPEAATKVAAQAAVDAIMTLSPARQFDDLLRAIRVLAIAKCPSLEHHGTVVRCCLMPLETNIVSAVTKQSLTRVLPPEWTSPG